MNFAWVIEHRDSEPSRPRYFTGRRHSAAMWSDPGDHSAACRFSRKQDAENIAGFAGFYEPNVTHRICEHGWDEPLAPAPAMSGEDAAFVLADYPDLDGTDAAHPAWWRGHDHTAKVFCKMVNDLLDGKPANGVAGEPWEFTRRRVASLGAANKRAEEADKKYDTLTKLYGRATAREEALKAEAAKLRKRVGELEKALAALIPWAGMSPEGPSWATDDAKRQNRKACNDAITRAANMFPPDYGADTQAPPATAKDVKS